MKVTFQLDTIVPGDLNILAAFNRAVQFVPEQDDGDMAAKKAKPKLEPVKPEPKLEPVKPEPKSEAEPVTTRKPAARAKPEPQLETLDFDELAELLPTLSKVTRKHARFSAKQYCVKLGDAVAGKNKVRGVLKTLGATNFDNLEDPAAFVEALIKVETEGRTKGVADDLDI